MNYPSIGSPHKVHLSAPGNRRCSLCGVDFESIGSYAFTRGTVERFLAAIRDGSPQPGGLVKLEPCDPEKALLLEVHES